MDAEVIGDKRDDKGRFGSGNRASSGRGPNKISTKVRDSIINFLESNIDRVQGDFDTLKPKERLQFVSELLSYAAPRLSSVQTELKGELQHKIEITWNEPGSNHLPDTDNKSSNGELQGIQSGLPDNS